MRRKIKKVLFISGFAILLILAIVIVLFQRFRAEFDDKKVMSELNAQGVFPVTELIPYGDYQIHAQYIGDLSNPKVLLIHGSPGYWFDFKKIFADLSLRDQFCLISYDRAGYGKTSVPAQELLKNQAKHAAAVIQHFGKSGEKFTVLGHSYGGAVLEQTILDYQDKISNAIYVAPCLSPDYQKAKWYNLMISGGLTNKMMPYELRTSNHEMMALEDCLRENGNRLSEIYIPTTYIQGKKDVLVPYKTLYYYLKHHKDVEYTLHDDLNHFVPWSKPSLIIEAIKTGYQKSQNN